MTPKDYIKKEIEIDERCQHFSTEQWMEQYAAETLAELERHKKLHQGMLDVQQELEAELERVKQGKAHETLALCKSTEAYLKLKATNETLKNKLTQTKRELAELKKGQSEPLPSKRFKIDFNGNVLAGIEIINNEPKVIGAINGWGNGISPDKCKVTPKE